MCHIECICDLIAQYCTYGNKDNIDALFAQYQTQIELYPKYDVVGSNVWH